MKIIRTLLLPAAFAGSLLPASEIEVQVDATIRDGSDRVFYLYFEPVATGITQIKRMDEDYYAQLWDLFDEAGPLGRVGHLKTEPLDGGSWIEGVTWRAWRTLKVPDRLNVSDKTLALYFQAIDRKTGYEGGV